MKNNFTDLLHRNSIYFVLFFSLFFLDATLTPTALVMGGLVNPIFYSFFKILFVCMTTLALCYFIFNRYKLHLLSKIFIIFSAFALFNGIIANSIDKTFFSHIYGATIPIVGFYLGANVFREISKEIYDKIEKLFFYSFYFLFVFMIIYFISYKFGYIHYFGLSSALPFFLAFFVAKKKYQHVALALVALLLSGKRVGLVQSSIVLLPFLFSWLANLSRNSTIFNKTSKTLVSLLALYGALNIFYNLGAFNRILESISLNWDTTENLYRATGGRSTEIRYGVLSLIEKPLKWLIGGGFGASFWEPIGMSEADSFWKIHYSHFSPMYLTLIYGLPFAIIVYLINLKIFIKSLLSKPTFFTLVFPMYFVGSFFGSEMFVDIKYWFFAGAAYYFSKNEESVTW